MKFVSMRDFRTLTTQIWNNLSEGEEIVITNNGRPRAFLVNIPDGFFEEVLTGIRRTNNQFKPSIHHSHEHTPEEKMTAMQRIRDLLTGIDGNSIDYKQLQAERRVAKYERND